jgi:hypothetical protein
MKLIRFALVIGLLYWAMQATAQGNLPPRNNINKADEQGKPHGMWLVSEDARMGEPAAIAFGNYEHGKKNGPWYRWNEDRQLIAMENFSNNLLDGEVKYYENGRMTALGHYRSIDQTAGIDSVIVTDPITGAESLRAVPKEKTTMRHGIWRFYDADNGRLVREEDYQVDEMVFAKDFPMSAADSAYYMKRAENLPHAKGKLYKPPLRKQTSYIK